MQRECCVFGSVFASEGDQGDSFCQFTRRMGCPRGQTRMIGGDPCGSSSKFLSCLGQITMTMIALRPSIDEE